MPQLAQLPKQAAHAQTHYAPCLRTVTSTGRAKLTRLRVHAAATQEATKLQDAISTVAAEMVKMSNLIPEHAVRTKKELEEPIKILKAQHEESEYKITTEDIDGWYDTGINTTNFVTDEGESTLGTLSFQQLAPKDLKIRIMPGYWLEMGKSKPQSYQVVIIFKIIEGEHEGVEGISIPNGTYELDGKKPYRQIVHFEQLRLHPRDTSTEGITKWKAALKEHNPSMGDDGVAVIDFPQPITGWRDYLYVNQGLHITVGNRNNVVCVRASEDPSKLTLHPN